jgi:thiol:disulfide interchange protein DsbC
MTQANSVLNFLKLQVNQVGLISLGVTGFFLALVLVTHVAQADSAAKATNSKASQAELLQAVEPLQAIRPDLPVEAVFPTSVPGLVGVDLPEGTTLYMTADGKHMIIGDMFAIGDELENLTEQRRSLKRKVIIDSIPLSDMVIFSPQGKVNAVLNVFTDVDCGYCRKLHNEIAEYGKYGIEVRYLAYPREGLQSETAQTMRSVWCSSDPAAALTRAKNSQRIAQRDCPNAPVDAQFAIGRQVGVTGTPAIVTAEGELFPGYIPAPQLAQRLGIDLQP